MLLILSTLHLLLGWLCFEISPLGFESIHKSAFEETTNGVEAVPYSSKSKQGPLNNSGTLYYYRGKYREAIKHLEKAVKRHKPHILAHLTLAKSYRCIGVLDSAYFHQKNLDRLIEEGEVFSKRVNQEKWFLHTDSLYVILTSDTSKQYYVHSSMALTCYLLGKEEEALQYMNKASSLNLNDKLIRAIIAVLDYDIHTLQSKRNDLFLRSDIFKRFLHKI